jgi:hypothetical protein
VVMDGKTNLRKTLGTSLGATREPIYLSPAQLATVLSVSTKSVYAWAKSDPSMPQLRLGGGRGGTLRFPAAGIAKWLKSHEGPPATTRSVQLVSSRTKAKLSRGLAS